jgi:hypothetical protein
MLLSAWGGLHTFLLVSIDDLCFLLRPYGPPSAQLLQSETDTRNPVPVVRFTFL